MVLFFNFSSTSNHLHRLQVENCDSNSRLVVDEDDYGELRLERVNSRAFNSFSAEIDLRCKNRINNSNDRGLVTWAFK